MLGRQRGWVWGKLARQNPDGNSQKIIRLRGSSVYITSLGSFSGRGSNQLILANGKGEAYLDEYWEWKEKLTDMAKEQYDAYFIPPLGWEEREV